MPRIVVMLWWVVIGLGLAACAAPERAPARELADTANRGSVVSLDDVTNGLVDNSRAANPLAGAFFGDGGTGDVRARTENHFATDLDATLDHSGTGKADATPALPKAERLLIQRGAVHIEVARPDDAQRAVLTKVQEWGGYLQNQIGTTLTVRLPAAKFDDAFTLARGTGRVLSEARDANDVTEEYVDLGIRLDNAKKSRDRLLEILQKADKVEDILKIEAELRRLTEEIERMEGRRKFLADQVAMATLTIGFHAVADMPASPRARARSRFAWIQRSGVESMSDDF